MMIVTIVAAATKQYMLGVSDCSMDNDVGTDDHLQGGSCMCGQVHVWSCVSVYRLRWKL